MTGVGLMARADLAHRAVEDAGEDRRVGGLVGTDSDHHHSEPMARSISRQARFTSSQLQMMNMHTKSPKTVRLVQSSPEACVFEPTKYAADMHRRVHVESELASGNK